MSTPWANLHLQAKWSDSFVIFYLKGWLLLSLSHAHLHLFFLPPGIYEQNLCVQLPKVWRWSQHTAQPFLACAGAPRHLQCPVSSSDIAAIFLHRLWGSLMGSFFYAPASPGYGDRSKRLEVQPCHHQQLLLGPHIISSQGWGSSKENPDQQVIGRRNRRFCAYWFSITAVSQAGPKRENR